MPSKITIHVANEFKVFEAAMFNLNDTMRYFLCPGRTDMRKGISSHPRHSAATWASVVSQPVPMSAAPIIRL